MCSADALWLDAITHLRYPVPGKLYEYLRSGRPIVALAHPDGPARQLVERVGGWETCIDAEAAGGMLARLVRDPATTSLNLAALEEWRRDRLAERLSEILEGCVR
jgi:hypothetical protein